MPQRFVVLVRSLLLLLLMLALGADTQASPTLTIDTPETTYESFQVERYEDVTAKMDFATVRQQAFKPSKNDFSEAYSDSALWFRFRVQNNTTQTIRRVLLFPSVFIDDITCHLIESDGTHTALKGGIRHSVDNDGKVEMANFPITLDQDTAGSRVAGLGDAAASDLLTGRAF